MMEKRRCFVIGVVLAICSLLTALSGCDTFFSPGESAEYDTWYYIAEGYEGLNAEGRGLTPSGMGITHGVTDNSNWTIDNDVGSRWRSATYRRKKGLAHLDLGFNVYILDLHGQANGYLVLSIVVNGEVVEKVEGAGTRGGIGFTLGDPADCSVTYKANWCTGGHAPVDDTIYREGDLVTIKGNEGGLEKIGWTLTGWNTSQDGGGQSWKPGDVGVMPGDNVVLYAEWTRVGAP